MVRTPRAGQNPVVAGNSSEVRRLIIMFGLGVGIMAAVFTMLGPTTPARNPGWVAPEDDGSRTTKVDYEFEISPWETNAKKLNAGISEAGAPGRMAEDKADLINSIAVPASRRHHNKFKYDPDYADVGGYELVDPVELAKPDNADRFRGRPVEVVGVLKKFERVDPAVYKLDAEAFDAARPVDVGYLLTDSGVMVKFLQVQFGSEMQLLLEGKRYKTMGVFYRIVQDLDGNLQPFILATRTTAALPLKLVDTLSPDLADRITATEDASLWTPFHRELEFLELAGYILKHGAKLIPEGAEIPLLRGRDPLDNPEEYRLKLVRAKGLLMYLRWESFEYEDMRKEDAPILGYWHAIISDPDPDTHVPQSVLFPVGSLPKELEDWHNLKPGEKTPRPVVEVTGFYYRIHAYDAMPRKRRKTEVNLPVVVAVAPPIVSAMVKQRPTEMSGFLIMFIAVGSGIVLILVFMLARDKRNATRLDEHIRTARLQRRKSRGMNLNLPNEPPSAPGSDEG